MSVKFRKLKDDVFSFAKESGILKGIEDPVVKRDFLLWMYKLGLVERRVPINIEISISS